MQQKLRSNPALLKNTVLMTIYVFRLLPAGYIDFYMDTEEEKQKVWKTIFKLTENGFIKKNIAYGLSFLYLTRKGHEFVTKELFKTKDTLPFYQYRTDRMERSTTSLHHFMNFVFIWEWITKNPDLVGKGIKIFEDSDRNNCKLKYRFSGRDMILYPDVLILLPDENKRDYYKAIIVENDAGSETYKPLFEKIIDYATFIEHGLTRMNISKVKLYYIFLSEKRIQSFLFSPKGAISFLKPYNVTQKYRNGVSAQLILTAYQKSELTVYYSFFDKKHPKGNYKFTQYSYTNELFAYDDSLGEKKIGWRTFI